MRCVAYALKQQIYRVPNMLTKPLDRLKPHVIALQTHWSSLTAFFKKEGCVLWAVQPGFSDANTGRALQFDGIFVRES